MKKAAIILLVIIIILVIIRVVFALIGMSIYNNAAATISDSLTTMSTQEVEAFNNQFESYRGSQTGSQISTLCGRIVKNSETFKGELDKNPNVKLITGDSDDGNILEAEYNLEDDGSGYVEELTNMKSKIKNKVYYNVSFEYATSGYISEIIIEYVGKDKDGTKDSTKVSNETNTVNNQTNDIVNNSIEESLERNETDVQVVNTVSSIESERSEENFTRYEGQRTGLEVYELMTDLKKNCTTYEYEPSKVPEIDYGPINETRTYEITAVYDKIEDKSSYLEKIVEIKNLLEDDHTYGVSVRYIGETVGQIVIGY